jgi:hypothetical protein
MLKAYGLARIHYLHAELNGTQVVGRERAAAEPALVLAMDAAFHTTLLWVRLLAQFEICLAHGLKHISPKQAGVVIYW